MLSWVDASRSVLEQGTGYGRSSIGAAEKVNVEYVSANPTGPMHVGHCRGAVFGDALASLLSFAGYDVTKEYYINDAGAQVDVLARSAFLRYREALGETIGEIPEGLYPGDYLVPVGKALAAEYGDKLTTQSEAEWLPAVRAKAIAMMMEMIKGDLAALNIRHDVFFSERSLNENGNDRVGATIAELRAKGDVYEGRLPPPKGAPRGDAVPDTDLGMASGAATLREDVFVTPLASLGDRAVTPTWRGTPSPPSSRAPKASAATASAPSAPPSRHRWATSRPSRM